jgi:hypothetical protein
VDKLSKDLADAQAFQNIIGAALSPSKWIANNAIQGTACQLGYASLRPADAVPDRGRSRK